jgi:hypothetical protein
MVLCCLVHQKLKVSNGGYKDTFYMDAKVLDMGAYDLVLGMD